LAHIERDPWVQRLNADAPQRDEAIAELRGFESRCRFTTWAMAIATRVGLSELRRRCYRDVSLNLSAEGDEFQFDAVDPIGSAEAQASRQGLLVLLQKLIAETLSDKQRNAIRGTLAGLPVEEIASRLQSNRNAIYKLVHDARLKLRQGFEASGVTSDDIRNIIG
jgi:RNA polymerase sigma factor (sigma-70 family)